MILISLPPLNTSSKLLYHTRKIFLQFQNGSFYIAKWAILLGKMIHLGK